MKENYDIAVIPGDGIGPEVIAAATDVLEAVWPGGMLLNLNHYPAGAEHFTKTGESLPVATLEACRNADAILHGAAGLPEIVHADGTEAGLDFTLTLRTDLELYANVRPILLQEGVKSPVVHANNIDYVIVRENSEGLYSSRGAGVQLGSEVAVDTVVQTRKGVERIVRFAFELARTRNGAPRDGVRRVTCCDKANVLRSYAFFRSIFDEVAAEYPDIEAKHCIVDAMMVHLVLRPDYYDVIVTENMFGDIISDLGAATIGGMGMAPSSEIGSKAALFQASHGSAPDIAGKGIANPYGTIVATANMLTWLGHRHNDARLLTTAETIIEAVDAVFSRGNVLTTDLGGSSRTDDIVMEISEHLRLSVEQSGAA